MVALASAGNELVVGRYNGTSTKYATLDGHEIELEIGKDYNIELCECKGANSGYLEREGDSISGHVNLKDFLILSNNVITRRKQGLA